MGPQGPLARLRGPPRAAVGAGWRRVSRPTPLLRVQLQRQLGQLPMFEGCERRHLVRVVRWGDVVEADAGEVLVRQDHGDWWFFVVLSGSLVLRRRGRSVGTVRAGTQIGAETIVGLRPQPATAVTAERSVLFVLGARYLLSLLGSSPACRAALFPGVTPDDYPGFAQRMLKEGRAEWQRVGLRPGWSRPTGGGDSGGGGTAPGGRWPTSNRRPGRTLSLREAVAVIAHTAPDTGTGGSGASAPSAGRASPWWHRGAIAAVVTAVVTSLLAYHPPLAVVTAGAPIDVARDITVAGVPTRHPEGRYLLLWIRVTRPDLAQSLMALVSGATTVSTGSDLPPADQAAAEQIGRAQYLDSQRAAVSATTALLGIDPRRISVRIRDRGFTGPSAGLIYALALTDILGGNRGARGRVLAATGALETDGHVDPVGWVALKVRGAEGAGAGVLLVPGAEAADARGYPGTLYGVSSLRQAVAWLTTHP